MLYLDDPGAAVDELGLRTVDTGANVLVAGTDHDVVFDRTLPAALVALPDLRELDYHPQVGPDHRTPGAEQRTGLHPSVS